MKIVKNYTIEKSVDDDFTLLSKHLSINKSQFVENRMKDFIKINIDTLKKIKQDDKNKDINN